ncbi:MAG: response regulator [Syntrophobacterales bacterium]|nr:response regulator [Syntrophobacterales bacterium]
MPDVVKMEKVKSKVVLVVDDYAPTRNLIVEALEQQGNYEGLEAENGIEAIKFLEKNPCEMVITDVMMPGMGGMELLQSMRERDFYIPVIMMTSRPAVDLTVSAMKNGVVDFLQKPFDIDKLLFKVDLYLREGSVPNPVSPQDSLAMKEEREQLSLKSYVYEAVERAAGDNDEIFQTIVELAMRIVDGESCALLLYDKEYRKFYPKAQKGEDYDFYRSNTASTITGIYQEAIDKKDAVMVHSDSDPFILPSLICAPLLIRGSVLGVLSIRKKRTGGVFTKNDLHQILSLAKRASLNLENKILYESMYDNLTSTFMALVAAIQVRDHYTEEHSRRVAETSVKIAQKMCLPPPEVERLRIASLLHDLGKISIPDNVLLKPGNLTEKEFEIIRQHPLTGDAILSYIPLLDDERLIVRHHHERWDGGGYPDGFAGNDIPPLARIMAVADSFDAMTSDRPYRKGLHHETAIYDIKTNKNKQFDKKIVDVFLGILEDDNSFS